MNFAHSAVATAGARAGMPNNPAERLAAQSAAIARALARLIRDGHVPIAFSAFDGSRPTVQIAASHRVAALVEAGLASYFKWDTTGGLPARHGMLHEGPEGVRVVWVERGN